MANNILGYDCDGNEIYEYAVLRAIWTNDISIEELEDADPRMYCAVVADDGNAYAISVNDGWHEELIRICESIPENAKIPTIIKPISEMVNYELVFCRGVYGNYEYTYEGDCKKLKNKLNKILSQKHKEKTLIKKQSKKI